MRTGRFTGRFTRYSVDGIAYGEEQLNDPHFEQGTSDWEVTAPGDANVVYDSENNQVDLVPSADDSAMVETEVNTSDDQLLCIEVGVEVGTVDLNVGTTSGGSDLLSTTLEAGTTTTEVEPTTDTTYVSLTNDAGETTATVSETSILPMVRLF